MIKKLELENTATYIEKTEIELKKINYFYGGNGSGKTTISNLIRKPEQYRNSKIKWEDEEIQTIVYNKYFVRENFNSLDSINGIFTLGEESKELLSKIDNNKAKLEENAKIKKELKASKENLKKQKEQEISKVEENCWTSKKTYESLFPNVLKGFGTKTKFFEKCKNELNNPEPLEELDTIMEDYNKVYKSELVKKEEVSNIFINEIIAIENNKIFEKVISGNEDMEIGKLITKLNNSAWIKEGTKYMDNSRNLCPFCQQKISDETKNIINSFFNETYEDDCNKIKILRDNYAKETEKIIQKLNDILKIEYKHREKLISIKENVENIIKENIDIIKSKIEKPNIKVELKSLVKKISEINEYINELNKKIIIDNSVVDNIIGEKKKIESKIWKKIVSDQENNIKNFIKKESGINKGLSAIEEKTRKNDEDIHSNKSEMERLESSITSVKHTVILINNILKNFGFDGFKLEEADKGKYKIIRNDGSGVNETLSEGEYNFISFLYFYHLIKGSNNPTGIIKDKVVVIDDPISSLDSNVLFIVSTLVKDLVSDCLKNKNRIKQIIVLTHNVYFYKEITYKGRGNNSNNDEKYWIIKKNNNISKVEGYDKNKIQTTYELLWNQLKEENINEKNAANILNTMRRILEYYFNVLGGKDYEKFVNKFEKDEQIIFKALISCINDGSHFITEDISLCITKECIDKYLLVFKKIFVVTKNIDHYNMMMHIEN